ncbi:MAG: hypothetical protein K8H88_18065, partial [Sandaracinaceae bacterium]|nr:hypothetical protein [Sandaracinaceae bacterium]
MSIRKPGLPPERARGAARKPIDAPIALVPFIDFLVVLVVFLLTAFGTSELSAQNLAGARHVDELGAWATVAIDRHAVTIDGRRMASTADLASRPETERIEALVTEVQRLARDWPILHPREPAMTRVTLQV